MNTQSPDLHGASPNTIWPIVGLCQIQSYNLQNIQPCWKFKSICFRGKVLTDGPLKLPVSFEVGNNLTQNINHRPCLVRKILPTMKQGVIVVEYGDPHRTPNRQVTTLL